MQPNREIEARYIQINRDNRWTWRQIWRISVVTGSVVELTSGCKHLAWGQAEGSHIRHFLHTLSTSTHGPEEHFAISLSLSRLEGFVIFPWVWGIGFPATAVPMSTTHIHSELHSHRLPHRHTDPNLLGLVLLWWNTKNKSKFGRKGFTLLTLACHSSLKEVRAGTWR